VLSSVGVDAREITLPLRNFQVCRDNCYEKVSSRQMTDPVQTRYRPATEDPCKPTRALNRLAKMRSSPRWFPTLQAAAQQLACAHCHRSVALSANSWSYAQHLFPPGLDQQPLLRISGIIPCLSAAAATPMQSIGDDCKGQLYGLR
jgi:hypothetical protein